MHNDLVSMAESHRRLNQNGELAAINRLKSLKFLEESQTAILGTAAEASSSYRARNFRTERLLIQFSYERKSQELCISQ